jgi:hypothetical protein
VLVSRDEANGDRFLRVVVFETEMRVVTFVFILFSVLEVEQVYDDVGKVFVGLVLTFGVLTGWVGYSNLSTCVGDAENDRVGI